MKTLTQTQLPEISEEGLDYLTPVTPKRRGADVVPPTKPRILKIFERFKGQDVVVDTPESLQEPEWSELDRAKSRPDLPVNCVSCPHRTSAKRCSIYLAFQENCLTRRADIADMNGIERVG